MPGAVAHVGDQLSLDAAADLSALQYRFMKVSGNRAVDKAAASSDNLLGILQNKPTDPEVALVKIAGGSKLEVDATTDIAAGDKLTSDANGKGIKTTTAGHEVGAIALEAATEDGEIISVLIVHKTVGA